MVIFRYFLCEMKVVYSINQLYRQNLLMQALRTNDTVVISTGMAMACMIHFAGLPVLLELAKGPGHVASLVEALLLAHQLAKLEIYFGLFTGKRLSEGNKVLPPRCWCLLAFQLTIEMMKPFSPLISTMHVVEYIHKLSTCHSLVGVAL